MTPVELTVPHARNYSHAPFVGGSLSMDRQHRRELKRDKFVDELGTLSSRARENQRILVTITAAAVAVAVIAYGIFFYRSNREKHAGVALAAAISTMDSPLLPPAGG